MTEPTDASPCMSDFCPETARVGVHWHILGQVVQLVAAAPEPVPWPHCPDHREVQHRDRKPPWCPSCGWNRGRPATPPRQIKEIAR